MEKERRASGIDMVGRIPWGTHFGLFFKTKQDLIDALVPYFKAGLENNEFCMWVTAEPLDVDEAKVYMARVMPDLDSYIEKGQIEIIPHTEWYTINGVFDGDRVLNGWVDKLKKARERGFAGLRLTGNESWLDRSVWKGFIDYEQAINDVIGQYEMIAMCSYPGDMCDANDVLDVVASHQFALSRRNGEWKVIEDQGQKNAKKALLDSEEKLRSLVENINYMVWELDEKYTFTYASRKTIDVLGYAPDEVVGKKPFEFLPSKDAEYLLEALNSFNVEPWLFKTITFTAIKKDGTPIVIETSGMPIYDANGNLIGFRGMNRDVTELKRAEEALRERDATLTRAQEIAHLGSWSWDIMTNEQEWSDESCRIFGFEPGEVRPDYDLFIGLIHPEDRERMIGNVKDLQELHMPYSTDYRIIRRDGSVRYVHAEAQITCNEKGQPIRLFGINQDITERKQAEDALLESDRKLAAELEVARSLQQVSTQLIQVDNGAALYDLLLDTLVEVMHADYASFHIFYPERGELRLLSYRGFNEQAVGSWEWVRPASKSLCGVAQRTGQRVGVPDVLKCDWMAGSEDLETCLQTSIRAVQTTPLVSRSGTLLGMFSTHWREPHELTVSEERALDILARQTADLIDRMRADEGAIAAKAQAELYLDLMGHDINNMHQVALGYLELSKELPADADQSVFLDKSMEVLQRSSKLIGNVRKLQKLRDGVLQFQDVDTCRVLTDIQSEYGAASKTITLNMNGYGRCVVRANELLHDVFSNLVNNAVKHTGDGSEIIVDLNAMDDNGKRYYRVAVIDNGPGIPDDSKERVFNRMNNGSSKGMGLGLYLVKSLVDSYGGRVWVEDRVRGDHTQGARFVVMLPAAEK